MVAAPEGCARKRDPRRTPDFLVAAGDRRDLFHRRPNENNRDRWRLGISRPLHRGADFKTAYQAYYNDLNPEGLEEQLAIAQFAVAHGTVVALLCGLGLALELLAPLMLLGRRWGLLLGSTFVVFHLSIASLMQLSFVFHRLLVLIYIVSPIYWIGWASRAVGSLFGRRGEIPPPTSP
jgi:hypothetical protein